jgi:hypothetical protein
MPILLGYLAIGAAFSAWGWGKRLSAKPGTLAPLTAGGAVRETAVMTLAWPLVAVANR